jgi:membrane protease YdiL (CAAX protease family)
LAFEKGRSLAALGLQFKPNLWWLWAWLIALAIAAGSVLLTMVLSGRHLVDLGEAIVATVAQQSPAQAEQLRAIPYLGLIQIGAAVTLGALLNAPILTITEELGWRGYLHDLWRRFGFWRASLATGFIWGLWHAPAIYLYDLNYPDQPVLGIGLFVIYCMLLSPLLTLVRDRGGATWAAGIFHGTINAVGGLTILVLSNPVFPWNGIVGIGGFLALAVAVAAIVVLTRAPRTAPVAS